MHEKHLWVQEWHEKRFPSARNIENYIQGSIWESLSSPHILIKQKQTFQQNDCNLLHYRNEISLWSHHIQICIPICTNIYTQFTSCSKVPDIRVLLCKRKKTYPRIPKSIGNVSSVPLYNANSSAENNLFSIWKQITQQQQQQNLSSNSRHHTS